MKVVKIDASWQPHENPGLKVGEEIEVTDPSRLIAEGKVKPVEQPLPKVSEETMKRVEKLMEVEEVKKVVPTEEEKREAKQVEEANKFIPEKVEKQKLPYPNGKTEFSQLTPDEAKMWRVENLRLAREARAKKNG